MHVREIGEIPLSEETPHGIRALARKSERPRHVDSIRLSIRRFVHKLHSAAFEKRRSVGIEKECDNVDMVQEKKIASFV